MLLELLYIPCIDMNRKHMKENSKNGIVKIISKNKKGNTNPSLGYSGIISAITEEK